MSTATVIAVSCSADYTMSKPNQERIFLLEGLGVQGDAHCGKTVKHRSRVAQDPNQPNLRQVHLVHTELFDELIDKGFSISPGQIGENITTRNIELLALPKNTILTIGESVKVQITGLRNPCTQLDGIQPGLMKAVLDRDKNGEQIRKAGIMGIVLTSGQVKAGDQITVGYPNEPFEKLQPV
jgi:MOSC domain-containing protein YiiM